MDDLELGKVGRFLLRKRPQSHFHLLVAYKQQSVSPTDLKLSLGTGLINIRDKRGRMFFTGRGKAKSVRAGAGKGSKSQGWAHTAKGEKKHTAAMMFHDAGRGTPFYRRAGAGKGSKLQGWAHTATTMFQDGGCGTPFPRRAGRPFLINMHVPGACIVPHYGQYVPLVLG